MIDCAPKTAFLNQEEVNYWVDGEGAKVAKRKYSFSGSYLESVSHNKSFLVQILFFDKVRIGDKPRKRGYTSRLRSSYHHPARV